ncbi:MAG: hypothetical protein GXY96_06300 [Tissierellia bacterium]|nr:hypothetical protein [Tissierellia bacterium]
MNRTIPVFKNSFGNYTIILFILVALFSLIVDGPKYNKKGFVKEYRIVRIISYLYISLGIIIFVFLRLV